MTRFLEYNVPSVKKEAKTITLPEGWYSCGMQEGTDISNQSVPFYHNEEEQGNPFEEYCQERTFLIEEVFSIVQGDRIGDRIQVTIDTWVNVY